METEFLTFQKFNERSQALELTQILKNEGLEVEFDDVEKNLDSNFTGNYLNEEFRVKIKSIDFEKATELLHKFYEVELSEIDDDYYLYKFTDQELLDVLKKPDEWGQIDYMLVQKILKQRGKEQNFETINTFQINRLNELKKPDSIEKKWIIIGYISSLLGGILGLIIGWQLKNNKKNNSKWRTSIFLFRAG